jgi:hypothetical protein
MARDGKRVSSRAKSLNLLMNGAGLIDSPELAGGFIVWLVKERRDWLSGRYLDSRWDVDELLRRREMIEGSDLLKLRIVM